MLSCVALSWNRCSKFAEVMFVAFRVDASTQIGSGHLMRCLTLAEALHTIGADILFICRELPGHLCSHVEACGFTVRRLPMPEEAASAGTGISHAAHGVDWAEDAAETASALAEETGWLVVDHYALDARWEWALRSRADRILVLDDLAERSHDCDLLLDQNYYETQEKRYMELVPTGCRVLAGPRYALLRPEFAKARERLNQRDGRVERILVFFGAGDYGNETLKALQSIRQLGRPEIGVDVVLGVNHPFKQAVKNSAATMPQVFCHDYVNNMAELMAAADLYLGAAGTTTWERCCLGLPSLVIAVAKNQIKPIQSLELIGAVQYLGESVEVSVEDISRALGSIMDAPSLLVAMGDAAMALVDGLGTHRCVAAMLEVRGAY